MPLANIALSILAGIHKYMCRIYLTQNDFTLHAINILNILQMLEDSLVRIV